MVTATGHEHQDADISATLRSLCGAVTSDARHRAHALVSSKCRVGSVLLICTFVLTVAVTLFMILQTLLGGTPHGYPVLALAFPVAVLFNNADLLRMLVDSFLPGTANKALYTTAVALQVATMVLVVCVDVKASWTARLGMAALLSVQVVLLTTLFVRKSTYDTEKQAVHCGIIARLRTVVDKVREREEVAGDRKRASSGGGGGNSSFGFYVLLIVDALADLVASAEGGAGASASIGDTLDALCRRAASTVSTGVASVSDVSDVEPTLPAHATVDTSSEACPAYVCPGPRPCPACHSTCNPPPRGPLPRCP